MISALSDIFGQGYLADKVIERHMKNNKKWGARDRRLFAETVYDLVRWWRPVYSCLGHEWQDSLLNLESNDPAVRRSFHFDLSEDSFWQVLGVWLVVSEKEWPPWLKLEGFDPEKVKSRWAQLQSLRASRESIPDWLDQKGEAELGKQWSQDLQALNESAPIFLRTNRLKTTSQELQKRLLQEGIEAIEVPEIQGGLKLSERANVFRTESFRMGLFEMQDGGSQQVVPLLQVEPGHRVIDACAGAGGKSLHIAAEMQNKGQLISLDIHEWKLKELKKRARRAGVSVAETRLIESTKVIKRLHDSADRVLLDVPCSGAGVLRRNPDSKWRLTPTECERLIELQRDLLLRYSKMVKAGGKMVYATCSLFPSENQDQIQWFLGEVKNGWELEQELVLHPGQGSGFDGFYAARLARV